MSPALQTSVLLIAVAVSLVGAAEWSYTDEPHWPAMCHAGSQQSPIDLAPLTSKLSQYDKFSFTNYENAAKVNLINNGHTAELQLLQPTTVSLSGGGLPGVYYLAQMHFHWGAEHTVQGRRHPMELHLVHYAKQYSGVGEGSQRPNGLAVVGVLFKESAEQNPRLDSLIEALKKVDDDVGTPFSMSQTPEAFLPGDLKAFYRYQGSLTTPGCNETVVWTVMTTTVPISKKQLDSFMALRAHSKLIGNNYRSIQSLNGRAVTTTQSGVIRITPVTSLLLALALLVFTV